MAQESLKASKQTTVSRFIISGRKIYTIIDWMDYDDQLEETLFKVRLYDGDVCWTGNFSRAFAEQFSKEFCESPDVYYGRVRETLTPIDQGLFKYELSYSNADSATFSWKRCYEEGKVTLVHGVVSLQRLPNSNREELLEYLMEENKKLRDTADRLSGKNAILNTDLNKYKDELNHFIESKNKLESKLYAKFATLLNAKKARIQLLEEHISKFDLLTEV